MKTTRAEKPLPKNRPSKRVGSGNLVRRLESIVTENGKFNYGTPERCLDVAEHVFATHRRMCSVLQECCQKHRIGLAGEHVDEAVVAQVEKMLAVFSMNVDVSPAEGGGWLAIDWRQNPPRTTEHETLVDAVDAVSSPNQMESGSNHTTP